MSPALLALSVSLAGGVGACLRYLADNAVPSHRKAEFPWGTTIINLSGSLALGLVVGFTVALGPWATIIGTGLLGGYTTFSTASLETVRLMVARRWTAALTNGFVVLVAGVVLAIAGLLIARGL